MSALASILGTYAVGHTLDHDGKAFTFGRINQGVKGALAIAHYKRAREAVYLTRGEGTQEEYELQLKEATALYRAGKFDFPEKEPMAYYMGPGLAELVAILTRTKIEDAARLVEEREVEVQHILLCIMAESFPNWKARLLQVEGQPGQQGKEIATLVSMLAGNASAPPN